MLKLVTPPAAEPVSVAELKAHMRVEISDDDTLIGQYGKTARIWCEDFTRRQFVTATWRLTLEDFPWGDRIELPRPPLQSVTSLTYVDDNGTTQTYDALSYRLITDEEPGYLLPVYNGDWPSYRADVDAIKVTYVAGYGLAVAVPENLKTAIKLLTAHFYEHREPVIGTGAVPQELPMSVKALLYPERVH